MKKTRKRKKVTFSVQVLIHGDWITTKNFDETQGYEMVRYYRELVRTEHLPVRVIEKHNGKPKKVLHFPIGIRGVSKNEGQN